MMRSLILVWTLLMSQQVFSSDLHEYFEIDLAAIEVEFSTLNSVILQLDEGTYVPSSSSFEIPTDSTASSNFFPIYGFPTFWAVFIPSCAASCCTANPVSGSCVGLISAGSIYYFTGDKQETTKALAGCAAAQAPIIVGLALYISILNGTI